MSEDEMTYFERRGDKMTEVHWGSKEIRDIFHKLDRARWEFNEIEERVMMDGFRGKAMSTDDQARLEEELEHACRQLNIGLRKMWDKMWEMREMKLEDAKKESPEQAPAARIPSAWVPTGTSMPVSTTHIAMVNPQYVECRKAVNRVRKRAKEAARPFEENDPLMINAHESVYLELRGIEKDLNDIRKQMKGLEVQFSHTDATNHTLTVQTNKTQGLDGA